MSIGHLGHAVIEAGDGVEAIEMLAANEVDVVLTDIEMPEMDGYGLLEHRSRDDRLRAIPFIVISGVDEMASIIRCIGLSPRHGRWTASRSWRAIAASTRRSSATSEGSRRSRRPPSPRR